MKVTREFLAELLDKMYDSCNIPEFEVRENYSGRGMYEKECLGFVSSNVLNIHGTLTATLAETERDCDAAGEYYDGPSWYDFNPRSDSMGLDFIVYYPNIQIEDE